MHLIFPLLGSLLYVAGALFLKRCAVLGVGAWRTTFVSNWTASILFLALIPLGGQIPDPAPWWQPAIVALLFLWGHPWHGLAIMALLAIQLCAMRRLLTDPKALAPWYNGTGVGPYVLGMLITAFALGSAA